MRAARDLVACLFLVLGVAACTAAATMAVFPAPGDVSALGLFVVGVGALVLGAVFGLAVD